jgi:hypothetical protein
VKTELLPSTQNVHDIITTKKKSTPEKLGGLPSTAFMKAKETEKTIKAVRNRGICSLNLLLFTEEDIFHVDLKGVNI